MESVTVWREYEGKKIKLGEFENAFFACLFVRAIINDAWENDLCGTISISYNFTAEED